MVCCLCGRIVKNRAGMYARGVRSMARNRVTEELLSTRSGQ